MIRFTKLHGLGNDFIMLQEPLPEGVDWNAVAPVLCHRRTGIGADGLLMVSAQPGGGCAYAHHQRRR